MLAAKIVASSLLKTSRLRASKSDQKTQNTREQGYITSLGAIGTR